MRLYSRLVRPGRVRSSMVPVFVAERAGRRDGVCSHTTPTPPPAGVRAQGLAMYRLV
ncbi:hypothetical protein BDZ94DRAFT_1256180 [Collybia nuda]|uniref:Uncharacterized protein n=1 Tax=Collybia nuda TaxID=64659 RepID=A0A9P5YA40_9AGAR|nr:hypothetical protein BDZ94DRAFT_1256180 [Collybia nuda]